jgi:alkanesulfonate monooxygenase SsuD/methylene tetrahydromethanopterin reductase-like flavin-dependent oxidoreductase (luciferase family)
MLRISTYFAAEPKTGEDERGRHAIEGPPEWIAERLREYVQAGCDGFVVNLGHDAPELEDRARRFGAEVMPLLT